MPWDPRPSRAISQIIFDPLQHRTSDCCRRIGTGGERTIKLADMDNGGDDDDDDHDGDKGSRRKKVVSIAVTLDENIPMGCSRVALLRERRNTNSSRHVGMLRFDRISAASTQHYTARVWLHYVDWLRRRRIYGFFPHPFPRSHILPHQFTFAFFGVSFWLKRCTLDFYEIRRYILKCFGTRDAEL